MTSLSHRSRIRCLPGLALYVMWPVMLFAQAADEEDNLSVSIDLQRLDNDNLFSSFADEVSSQITLLAPQVAARFEPGRQRIELAYEGEYASYTDSAPDDYEDHRVGLGGYFDLGRRTHWDVVGNYQDAHEDRGSGISQGFQSETALLLTEPDEFRSTQALSRLTFGNPESTGNLIIEAGIDDFQYRNHRNRTRIFDRDSVYGDAGLRYRVAPNTALVFNLRATEIEYPFDRTGLPTLNNTEYRALIGATWDATDKVEGDVRVGYVKKDYESALRPEFSEPSWEASVRFTPRTYSSIELSAARYPSETTAVNGDVIDNHRYSIAWTHEWSERVETRLDAARVDEDFGAVSQGREQQSERYAFSVSYHQRDWLSWELGVEVDSRDSDVDRFNYDGKIIRIGARFSF